MTNDSKDQGREAFDKWYESEKLQYWLMCADKEMCFGIWQAAVATSASALARDEASVDAVACPECGGSLTTWKCLCDPIWPGYTRSSSAATVSDAASVPADCDVRKILLRVVPGDGDGHEVYAKNVGEVEQLLSKLGERLENYLDGTTQVE